MARPRPRGAPTPLTAPDARALIALLALTLGLAGLLALGAEGEVGSHRLASARVLREHLAATGRGAVDAVAGALGGALAEALGPAVAARAASPYELLASPLALAQRPAAGGVLACAAPAPTWVRVDVRDGSFAAAGAALPRRWPAGRATPRWPWCVSRCRAPVDGGGDAPYAVVFGRGAAAGRALALGVRRAPYEAPIAAYGLVTCAEAFGPRLVGRGAPPGRRRRGRARRGARRLARRRGGRRARAGERAALAAGGPTATSPSRAWPASSCGRARGPARRGAWSSPSGGAGGS
jgi:hypothetical protein